MPLETYLAQLIYPLLTKPEEVTITQGNDEMGLLFSLKVAKEDMGSVIGKQGETAKAVRHLLRIAGIKQNARASLKIVEPEGSTHRTYPRKTQTDRELAA